MCRYTWSPVCGFFLPFYHSWPTICYILSNSSQGFWIQSHEAVYQVVPLKGLQFRDLRSQAWIVRPKRKRSMAFRGDCVETLEMLFVLLSCQCPSFFSLVAMKGLSSKSCKKKGLNPSSSYSPNKDIPENSTNQGRCEKKSAAPLSSLDCFFGLNSGWNL